MSHVEYHQDVCVRALGEDSCACFYSVTTAAVPPAQKAESESVCLALSPLWGNSGHSDFSLQRRH